MVPKSRLKWFDSYIQSQEKLNEFQNERLKNIINFFFGIIFFVFNLKFYLVFFDLFI